MPKMKYSVVDKVIDQRQPWFMACVRVNGQRSNWSNRKWLSFRWGI